VLVDEGGCSSTRLVLVDEVGAVDGELLVDEGVADDGTRVRSTESCWSTRVLLMMGRGCGRRRAAGRRGCC
jgi:hypothetical protein